MAFRKTNTQQNSKPIEQEIAELQRKFRCLENCKRTSNEDAQEKIRKQRAAIEKLTRENKKMKSELMETRAAPGAMADNRMALATVEQLKQTKEGLKYKLEGEKEERKSLTAKVETTMKKIASVREDMRRSGGVNAALDNSKAIQKQIRILENRLDKALQKFNEAIAANRSLREQIDTLRRERVVFEDISRKLENELSEKKKEMARIIETANAAYEARDSAQAQMAALKQQADKEHQEFEKEWQALGKLIENDKRLKEVMMKQKVAKGSTEVTIKEETALRKKITKNASETAATLGNIEANEDKLKKYEDLFFRIQAATGINDIDDLVQNFIHAEDQNFSLFKYNNELSADIEKLEQQIAEYRDEYVTLSGSSSRKEDTEKMKILEDLEEKWNDIDHKATAYEMKWNETNMTLSHVRAGIESMFQRLGCTADDLPSGMGTGQISEANMMAYLAVIERRTDDLLKLYEALKTDDDDVEPQRKTQVNSSANMQIKPPSTVEDYTDEEDDEDDDDSRPFTRDELKAKTMRAISKRQRKSRNKSGPQDK